MNLRGKMAQTQSESLEEINQRQSLLVFDVYHQLHFCENDPVNGT